VPVVDRLLYGAMLSVVPTVQGDVADVDVTAAYAESNDPAAGPFAGSAAVAGPSVPPPSTAPATRPAGRPTPTATHATSATHAPGAIDRVDATVHHVATSVRLPLGKPVVVGAMTLHPRVGGPSERRELLFVMRVRAE
ncbi:MAG TPA: hypothetical protein VF796_20110, partial [Humisphaera sp.]